MEGSVQEAIPGSSACGAVRGVTGGGPGPWEPSGAGEARSPHLTSTWPGLCECRAQTTAPSTRTFSSDGNVLRSVQYGAHWPHVALS